MGEKERRSEGAREKSSATAAGAPNSGEGGGGGQLGGMRKDFRLETP